MGTFNGTNGDDYFEADPINESWNLAGGFGDDTLIGGDLNDNLHGGGYSHDSLVGGKGNDTYYIDSYSDVIVEQANEGIDTVFSRVNHTLGSNFENLYLIPDNRAYSGVGNNKNNYIKGSSRNNHLRGEFGNDILDGDAGNDILVGTKYNDSQIDEVDILTGGSGSDEFRLSSSSKVFYAKSGSSDYAVIKDFDKNFDKIQLEGSSSSYRLGGVSNSSGTGLYKTGFGDDLVAIVQGSTNLSLTSSYFKYV